MIGDIQTKKIEYFKIKLIFHNKPFTYTSCYIDIYRVRYIMSSQQTLEMFQQSIFRQTFCPAQRRRYERTVKERHNLLACNKIETIEMHETIKVNLNIGSDVHLDIVVDTETNLIKVKFNIQDFGAGVHLDITLMPYVPEPSKYVFKVAGSSGNIYDVSLLSNNTFVCNCPDFTNEERPHGCNCALSRCWCKHVCFIAGKVGKIYDVQAYRNKVITNEQRNSLIACIPSVWKDRKIVNYDYLNAFKAFMLERDNANEADDEFDAKNARNLTDDCGICFCPLVGDKGEKDLKACPQCMKAVHTNCIVPWLKIANQKCCANCRSPSWKRLKVTDENTYDSLETRVENIRAMRRLRRHAADV